MDTNKIWNVYKGGVKMTLRQRIIGTEYPINLANEIMIYAHKEDDVETYPFDIVGSMEYILHTAISEKRRKILEMHWRDHMTLEQKR